MKVKQFFNSDFRDFSIYDTKRSIPSIVDGFKPSQRKVIYGMLKRGESLGEVKVEQAGAYIASVSDYHHGEDSLKGILVNMAQEFPGSNNMNLFVPEGQFGSKLSHGSASYRYIFTKIHPNLRKLIRKEDDCILIDQFSDGEKIEPMHYYPILPIVLINGADGIGTGYATNILNYNPDDLKKNILSILEGKNPRGTLVPWYKGFNGTIERTEEGQVIIKGKLEIVNSTTIHISELPVGRELDWYKAHLNKLEDDGIVKDWDDDSTEEEWSFTCRVPRSTTNLGEGKLMDVFKLISKDTENYTLWNEHGEIQIFNSVQDIINHFVEFRLDRYEVRRQKQIELYNGELDWLNEKLRFVQYYLANHDQFARKKKDQLFKMLEKENFDNIDGLLSMKIYTLTKDEIDKLKQQIKDVKVKITELEKTSNIEMYKTELKD